MNERHEHPSFLNLDRLALGAASEPSVRAHVEGCVRCQRHVRAVQQAPAHPRVSPRPSRPRSKRALWAGGGLAAAAAAALALLPQQPVDDAPAFTTRRGAVAVAVYVKRAGEVWLWDGQQPIAPGDRLRLALTPEDYAHVAVLTRRDERAPWTSLYAAELAPGREVLLPAAWKVDDAPGPERLCVVLNRDPVREAQAACEDESATVRPGAPWVRHYRIPKQAVPAKREGE